MTDSRCEASRAEETRSRRPSSSRDVPMTGCRIRRTTRFRAVSSSVTESTRNGESSTFVSRIVPGAVNPSVATSGLNARTTHGCSRRPSTNSNVEQTRP